MTRKDRPSLPSRAVLAVLFGSFALAGAIGAVGYYELIWYRRVAADHVPPGTIAAARIDVEHAILFEPVRKNLLPLLNEPLGGTATGLVAPRVERLEKRTGAKIGRDLREILVAVGGAPGDWVVVVGGRYPKRILVGAIAEVFREEGLACALTRDDTILVVVGSGIALGQAEDGAVLVAANQERLTQALPSQQTYLALGLGREGAGGFALKRDFDIAGTLRLGSPVTLEAVARFAPGTATRAARTAVEAFLGSLRAAGSVGDPRARRALLDDVTVGPVSAGTVPITAQWDRDDLDRAAASIAAVVRGWLRP